MPTNQLPPAAPANDTVKDHAREPRPLPPAAQRALAEAAARRAEREGKNSADSPKEVNGRGGLEPTRYGDWEVNGLTSDF